MEQDVYVDLLFLINFSMDFLCFYISSGILRRKLNPIKTVVSSAIGGIYSVAVLFFEMNSAVSFIIDMLICFIMCGITFAGKDQGIKKVLFYSAVYFMVSALIGGIMSAIFSMLNKYEFKENSISEDGISVWLFALLAIVSGAVSLLGGRFFKKNAARRKCKVFIMIDGKRCELSGFNDSGNLLKDSITGKCVILVERSRVMGILPSSISGALISNDITKLDSVTGSDGRRIRIIPGRGIGGSDILIAIVPDKIEIETGKGSRYAVDALLAPTELGNADIESLIPDELMA